MDLKNILYVHGFNGSSCGGSFKKILEALPDGYLLHSIDYDQSDCSVARRQIMDYIDTCHISLVIGSSLGGFITLTLGGVPRFVINPCLKPSAELCKITTPDAEYQKLISTYIPYEDWMEKYSDYEERILVKGFFATDDELLGTKYVGYFAKYYGNYEMISGGHHVSAEGARQLFAHIDEYWKHVDRLSRNSDAMDDLIADAFS